MSLPGNRYSVLKQFPYWSVSPSLIRSCSPVGVSSVMTISWVLVVHVLGEQYKNFLPVSGLIVVSEASDSQGYSPAGQFPEAFEQEFVAGIKMLFAQTGTSSHLTTGIPLYLYAVVQTCTASLAHSLIEGANAIVESRLK